MILRKKNSKKKCWLYILECKSTTGKITYYTGISNNLEKRFAQHKEGKGAKYTRNKTVKLVHFEEYKNRADAFRREYQIKKYGHKKKKEIIDRKSPKCPECRIPLIASDMRVARGAWHHANSRAGLANETKKERYYSCIIIVSLMSHHHY